MFQTFPSITELDQTVRGYLYKYKYTLLPSTEKVLKCIWRNAGEVYGVCHCTVEKIATEAKISERQVGRALNQLIKLNVISRVPTYKENGAQSRNLLVIQPDFNYTAISKEDDEAGLS
ncbi:hypothetical protein [Sutcliffiella cohnii]|uniref:hypothetical protein n=1 Tax=Sutcliffiella cohnii TaxID=33932 RepID=UPI002E22253A|nr:hypothetical protein [Sutcliffiella cohnii]